MQVKLKLPRKGVKYEVGDHVQFFEDLHNDEGLYGEGILRKKTEEMSPLTFIIEDNYGSPRLQEVWSYEKWELEVIDVTEYGSYRGFKVGDVINRRLKCFARVGIPAASVMPLEKAKKYSEIVDNFEIVPGWGQCF